MNNMISDADFRVIEESSARDICNRKLFDKIRSSLRIVKNELMPKNIIRLNSLVLVWHSILKKNVRFRVVAPDRVDLGKKMISVLAPIGMAIIGKKENDTICVSIDGIEKELKIIKVINQ